MQFSSRFTVALHIFACIGYFGGRERITSDFLAASIGTNPVIIRRLLLQLKEAALVTVSRGTDGVSCARDAADITLLDVYRAVEKQGLFHFHENPCPACPVGGNIHTLLDGRLQDITDAMEDAMRHQTIEDLWRDMGEIAGGKGTRCESR